MKKAASKAALFFRDPLSQKNSLPENCSCRSVNRTPLVLFGVPSGVLV
jgi:hypothetical protein